MNRNISILSVMVMITVAVMATVTVAFATPNEGGNGQTKVTLCHKDMNTITVGAPAQAAHERHGDTLGPCGDGQPPGGGTLDPTTLTTTAITPQTVGHPIADVATLSGSGLHQPTGTITFNAYGPDDEDCSGEPAFTSEVDVNGEGDYSSEEFTPSAVGTYRWTAEYSGDDNNTPSSSECNAPNELSEVT